jgi:hypothetical protein
MKKTLTKASSKKNRSSKKSSKEKLPALPLRAPRLPWASKDRGTKIIKYITKENGELETKEERKKRLAEREALTLRCFKMAYDNHHRQQREN